MDIIEELSLVVFRDVKKISRLMPNGEFREISFTKNGRIKIAEDIETKYSDYEIRIYLKTKIQTNVPAGTTTSSVEPGTLVAGVVPDSSSV